MMTPLARDIFFCDYEPRPGDVVVEAGAGSGTETAEMARLVGSEGLVIAVEPHPDEFAKLSALDLPEHVRLVNAALGVEPGAAWITDGEFPERNSTVAHDTGGIKVEVTTLDLLAETVPTIHYLKMNIEGSEVLALEGFRAGLGRTRNVVISCHDFLGMPTKADVFRVLVEAGFVVHGREHADPCIADYVYGRRA